MLAAEILALRRLDTDKRNGRPCFQMGQYKARVYDEYAHLTYVDSSGRLVLMILEERDEEWFLSSMQAPRINYEGQMDLIYFPRSFSPDDNMTRALQEGAEARDRRLSKPKDEDEEGGGDADDEES